MEYIIIIVLIFFALLIAKAIIIYFLNLLRSFSNSFINLLFKPIKNPFKKPKKVSIYDTKPHYKKTGYFFTHSERVFYDILQKINKDNLYIIFSKIRLADLLYVPDYVQNNYTYFNKIKAKHIDFIIFDKTHISPVLGIELDDSTHSLPERIERDQFVDKILKEAGLPLLRVPVSNTYNIDKLKNDINSLLWQNSDMIFSK